jgi:hypothetical protein
MSAEWPQVGAEALLALGRDDVEEVLRQVEQLDAAGSRQLAEACHELHREARLRAGVLETQA